MMLCTIIIYLKFFVSWLWLDEIRFPKKLRIFWIYKLYCVKILSDLSIEFEKFPIAVGMFSIPIVWFLQFATFWNVPLSGSCLTRLQCDSQLCPALCVPSQAGIHFLCQTPSFCSRRKVQNTYTAITSCSHPSQAKSMAIVFLFWPCK